MKPYAKILVPTDFSEHAVEALSTAIDIAKRYGASITLLHVIEPIVYAFPEASGFYAGLQFAQANDELAKALEAQKQAAIGSGAANVSTVQLNGHPPSLIVEHAKSGGFDLIVMGTHGRRGFSHVMMGSVAERVVRMAPCAVLTVRKPQV